MEKERLLITVIELCARDLVKSLCKQIELFQSESIPPNFNFLKNLIKQTVYEYSNNLKRLLNSVLISPDLLFQEEEKEGTEREANNGRQK